MLLPSPVIVVTLLLLQSPATLGSDCPEGEVLGLDGSCVTKFVIPKKKAVCPKLSIDNGEIFILGRMVQFYCDTGYVRVPDTEVAICQVAGVWSKMVPVCLKPGCQVPASPSSGSVSTSYNSSLAQFSCMPGYSMSGPTTLACEDGTHWNGSTPLCMLETIQQDQPGVKGTTSTASPGNSVQSGMLVMLLWALVSFNCLVTN